MTSSDRQTVAVLTNGNSKALAFLCVISVLTTIALLVGCGGKKRVAGPKFNLVIGDLVPLSGDLKSFGPPGRKAAELAVKEIRKTLKQENLRTRVTMKNANTATDPETAVRAARGLVLRNKATCLVGPWASFNAIEVGRRVATRLGVPMISPSATVDKLTDLSDGGFVFRTAPADRQQAKALADAIADDAGKGSTVNVGARDDQYGRSLRKLFVQAWRAKGGKIGRSVTFRPGAGNYTPIAKRLMSGSPDRLVIIDLPESFEKLIAQLDRRQGFDPQHLWLTDGLASSSLPKDVGRHVIEGASGTAPSAPRTGKTAVAFDKLYRDAGGPSRQVFDANSFDAVMLCFLASMAARSNDPAKIRAKLRDVSGPGGKTVTFENLDEAVDILLRGEEIDYVGPSGPIDLAGSGDPSAATYDIFTFKRGKIKSTRQVFVGTKQD